MSKTDNTVKRADARPWLARKPGWGIAAMLVGAVMFTLIALNVRSNGPLLAWDVPVAEALHRRATQDSDILRKAAIFMSTWGRETAAIIVAVLAVYFLWRRRWRLLSLLVIGVLGGNTWFEVLSRLFARHRPVFPDPLDPLPGPGFPSGHSMTSMLLYSLILYLVLPRLPRGLWRVLASAATVALVLLIGFSRLYLGSHYLTDVFGGYSFGLFWGGLVYTSLEVFYARRAARKGQAGPAHTAEPPRA